MNNRVFVKVGDYELAANNAGSGLPKITQV